jgi:hypothetical protein
VEDDMPLILLLVSEMIKCRATFNQYLGAPPLCSGSSKHQQHSVTPIF